jgi:hypothetical protein
LSYVTRMEIDVAVLYRGSLAHYLVDRDDVQVYSANLISYSGDGEKPPGFVQFEKEGRGYAGNTPDQNLMEDLYVAVYDRIDRDSNI